MLTGIDRCFPSFCRTARPNSVLIGDVRGLRRVRQRGTALDGGMQERQDGRFHTGGDLSGGHAATIDHSGVHLGSELAASETPNRQTPAIPQVEGLRPVRIDAEVDFWVGVLTPMIGGSGSATSSGNV